MGRIRIIFGIIAIVCIAAAFNIGVFQENLFSSPVLILLALGLLTGLVWAILSLSTVVSSFGKGKTLYGLNTVISSLVFLLICIVLYAFASHWNKQWDLTQEGRRDLAEQTVQVLKGLEQDVSVICFFVETGDALVDVSREKTRLFLERCQELTPHLLVEFVDPQRHPEQLEALDVKRVSVEGAVVVRCESRQRVIPLSEVTSRLEERDFTNALINVVRSAQPKVYFLTGHGEHRVDLPDGTPAFGAWLAKEAYVAQPLAIRISDPQIPPDCDVLVINGPESDLHPTELAAIEEYLNRGGRLMVLLDPWIILNRAEGGVEHLRPWLNARFGIDVGNNILISGVKGNAVMELFPKIGQDPAYAYYEQTGTTPRPCFEPGHAITRGFDQVMRLKNVRTVGLVRKLPDGVTGMEILNTMPGCWAETDLESLQKERRATIDPGESEGPLPIAVAVDVKTGDRDARIVVIGDSDLTLDEDIQYAGHLNFLLNSIAWLSESDELIAIRPTGKEDAPLVLSPNQERLVAWVASLGTVQAVALAGLIAYLIRRKCR